MSDVEQFQIPANGLVFDALAVGPADGRLVLLLHGFPQTSWSWRGVWPALAEAGYRVVAYDQRGYSPGAQPDGVENYRMPHLLADTLGVLDALGAAQADVVGHDWGAAVAWQLAARHPERLRTVTAVSVPHPLAFLHALLTDDDQRAKSQYMRVFAQPGTEHDLLSDDAAGLRGLFGGVPEVDVARVLDRLGSPTALRHALDWYAAQSRHDLDGLEPIRVPTLHVWSDQDLALGEVATHASAEHVAAPYRLEVLPGVSHWVPEQAAEQLTRLVLDHLASHPG